MHNERHSLNTHFLIVHHHCGLNQEMKATFSIMNATVPKARMINPCPLVGILGNMKFDSMCTSTATMIHDDVTKHASAMSTLKKH
jgi:hypothetical protein